MTALREGKTLARALGHRHCRLKRGRSAPTWKFWVILALGCFVPSVYGQQVGDTDSTLAQIEHVIIFYADGHSFDNLYGLYPGANGVLRGGAETWVQVDRDGTPLRTLPPVWKLAVSADNDYPHNLPNLPFRLDAPPVIGSINRTTRDLVARFYINKEQINDGKLDSYVALSDAGALTMGYYDGAALPMWKLASEFTLADNFFAAAFGSSFLNHLWLVCACTPAYLNAPASLISVLDEKGRLVKANSSPNSAINGPPQFLRDGPLTPDGFAVNTLQPPYQPSGTPPALGGDLRLADSAVGTRVLPPATDMTIGDLLSAAGVEWAWYAESWDAAIADGTQPRNEPRKVIYDSKGANFQAHLQPFNYFAKFAPGTAMRAQHLKDASLFLEDVRTNKLPAVAFYKPEGSNSEHAGYGNIVLGNAHIADLISAVRTSQAWRTTLIVVTYDSYGGFWDHVTPPQSDRWGPGNRVPTIIIGPMAKRGYVDSTLYDTTSILKLLSRRFKLAPLPGIRENVGDLTNALISNVTNSTFVGVNCPNQPPNIIDVAFTWCATDHGYNEGASCGREALMGSAAVPAGLPQFMLANVWDRSEMMKATLVAWRMGKHDAATTAAACCQIHNRPVYACLSANSTSVSAWLARH